MSADITTTIEIAGLQVKRTDCPYSTPGEIGIVIQAPDLPRIVIEREFYRGEWIVGIESSMKTMSPAAALAYGAIWSYACGIAADLEADVIPAPEF